MTDYRRMVWQYYASVVAECVKLLCVGSMMAEVSWAIKYHFPLWDDIAMPLTTLLWWMADFVDSHTRMYRF